MGVQIFQNSKTAYRDKMAEMEEDGGLKKGVGEKTQLERGRGDDVEGWKRVVESRREKERKKERNISRRQRTRRGKNSEVMDLKGRSLKEKEPKKEGARIICT